MQEELSAINDAERDSNATAKSCPESRLSDQIEISAKKSQIEQRAFGNSSVDAIQAFQIPINESLNEQTKGRICTTTWRIYHAKQQNAEDINARVEELEFSS